MLDYSMNIGGVAISNLTKYKVAEEIIKTIKKELPERCQTAAIIKIILSDVESMIKEKPVKL